MLQTLYSANWEWQNIPSGEKIESRTLNQSIKDSKRLENLTKNQTNGIEMDITVKQNKAAFWGSLVYMQDTKNKGEKSIFHFYLTNEKLITIGADLLQLKHNQLDILKEKMNEAENPIEGFLILLGEITAHFLKQIDTFEMALHDLFWEIKKRNTVNTLDRVAYADQDLLVWKNLIIPVAEVRMALREAFGEQITEGIHYKRLRDRLERALFLVKSYEEEIDSLLDFESLVSAHRGNEIMKTLTVITTLLAPATVLGAIWGMNFEHMPELKWKFGYLFSGFLILLSTLALQFYLSKKGWMGDILNTKRRKSFFK